MIVRDSSLDWKSLLDPPPIANSIPTAYHRDGPSAAEYVASPDERARQETYQAMRSRLFFCSQSLGKLLACVLVFAFAWTGLQAQVLARFNLSELDANAAADVVTVSVNDPVYLRPKKYQGYRLRAVLQKHLLGNARSAPGSSIIFYTRDGYNPGMPLTDALAGNGVLAFRDVEAASSKWLGFDHNGATEVPGPFYLVWPGESGSERRHPWPYQIESIELVAAGTFRNAEPPASSDSTVNDGYKLFSQTCMKCHSVNFVGGTMGGELNVPVNVTEAWNEPVLTKFITDPRSVRASSRMPKPEVSPAETNIILRYLHTMADHKVCATEADCDSRRPRE